jgi:hypothetical protein
MGNFNRHTEQHDDKLQWYQDTWNSDYSRAVMSEGTSAELDEVEKKEREENQDVLEYVMISKYTAREFTQEVNAKLNDGWELQGDAFDSDKYLCQAMVLRGVKEDK